MVLHDSKDNVSLVLYRGESDGCYHYNHEIESLHVISFDVETDSNQNWGTYPVGRCRQGICRCSDTKRYDLSRI